MPFPSERRGSTGIRTRLLNSSSTVAIAPQKLTLHTLQWGVLVV